MSRKLQHQFYFSNIRKDTNKKGPIPVKINQRKIEKVGLNLNLNNSFSNEFSTMPKEEDDNNEENDLLAQSYSFNQINKYREKILNEPSTIILESLIYTKENGGRANINKKIKFITPKDVSGLFTKLLNKNRESQEEYLKLRNIILNENDIKAFFKDNFNEKELQKLFNQIININYSLNTYFTSNNVNPLISLKKLFEEMTLTNTNNIRLNYNEKYNKLLPIIYRCRKIKGDGNCYYRAVMFRYFEYIILNKNLIVLKKIILEMNQAFNSKEIQERLYIKMDCNFKPKLHLNIMYLILNLLENNKIKESYELFVKCVLSCAIFDYGLILYFRYILYLYIKNNENKLYTKSFPVKVGNFLPAKYENEKGEFEFQKFYTNYLLKMFTEAEKIIIYLTPFVLGINLDIIIFEDNEDKIVKRFSYQEENGENKINDNAITLLNRNAHYELVYTYDEYIKFNEIYKNCEIIDENSEEKIFGNLNDNHFSLFQNNIINNKRGTNTMVYRANNNKDKNLFNKNSNSKTIIIQKKIKNSPNTNSNQIKRQDNGFQENANINNKTKEQQKNNLINLDNNRSYNELKNSINIEANNKPKIKRKTENEIPFGHPEFKGNDDLITNYLDKIDNMFLNNIKYVECLKCKKRETSFIQDKYEFCNDCLPNEIIYLLAADYSNYLKTENSKKKKYKINSIKLDKYVLDIKNILDVFGIFIENFDENYLYNFLKQFVCISCLKPIDKNNNSKVKFPCGCAICNKDELEKYFTEQNILSDNYICLCGYKYQPKDFYFLAEESNKIGNDCICFLTINIFYKDILSKGCCRCGSKKKFTEIKYKVEKNNTNEFSFEDYLKSNNINLVHYLCKDCEKKYKNQKFVCYFCNKIHIYIIE